MPLAATKLEYRNPKLEIHLPEAGKNSKHKGFNVQDRNTVLKVFVI
jgi:hypothetical protein